MTLTRSATLAGSVPGSTPRRPLGRNPPLDIESIELDVRDSRICRKSDRVTVHEACRPYPRVTQQSRSGGVSGSAVSSGSTVREGLQAVLPGDTAESVPRGSGSSLRMVNRAGVIRINLTAVHEVLVVDASRKPPHPMNLKHRRSPRRAGPARCRSRRRRELSAMRLLLTCVQNGHGEMVLR